MSKIPKNRMIGFLKPKRNMESKVFDPIYEEALLVIEYLETIRRKQQAESVAKSDVTYGFLRENGSFCRSVHGGKIPFTTETCSCGAHAKKLCQLTDDGYLVSAAMPHNLAFHRDEIPKDELEKWVKFCKDFLEKKSREQLRTRDCASETERTRDRDVVEKARVISLTAPAFEAGKPTQLNGVVRCPMCKQDAPASFYDVGFISDLDDSKPGAWKTTFTYSVEKKRCTNCYSVLNF